MEGQYSRLVDWDDKPMPTRNEGEILIQADATGWRVLRCCHSVLTLQESYNLVEDYLPQIINGTMGDPEYGKLGDLRCFHASPTTRHEAIRQCLYYRLFSYSHFVFREPILRLMNLVDTLRDHLADLWPTLAEGFAETFTWHVSWNVNNLFKGSHMTVGGLHYTPDEVIANCDEIRTTFRRVFGTDPDLSGLVTEYASEVRSCEARLLAEDRIRSDGATYDEVKTLLETEPCLYRKVNPFVEARARATSPTSPTSPTNPTPPYSSRDLYESIRTTRQNESDRRARLPVDDFRGMHNLMSNIVAKG